MKMTFSFMICTLIMGAFISVTYWVYGISKFNFEGQLLIVAWDAFKIKSSYPVLMSLWVKSLFFGFGISFIVLFVRAELDSLLGSSSKIRGSKLVSSRKLDSITRLNKRKEDFEQQIEIAGVAVPIGCESSHFLLVGSTGSGKSVAQTEIISHAINRGDRMIVVDPNGELYSKFGGDEDQLLNPFDRRTVKWSFFNEIRQSYDYDQLAKSVIPDAADPSAQQWHGYARLLFAAVLKVQVLRGDLDDQQLIDWCTKAPIDSLREHLRGSPIMGMFDSDAGKAMGSTRFILTSCLSVYQYFQHGSFSLRNWLDSGNGNLYISWRKDMLATVRPLISAWVEILISHSLTLSHKNPRRLWLMLDELSSLGHVSSLVDGLTLGRKHGLRIVACLQSTSQIDAIYGQSVAITLLSCFRNILALGCSKSESKTAEMISAGLGQSEIERDVVSHTQSSNSKTKSITRQRELRTIVLPSELTQLVPLEGYLALSGDLPVAKVELKVDDLPVIRSAFEERL